MNPLAAIPIVSTLLQFVNKKADNVVEQKELAGYIDSLAKISPAGAIASAIHLNARWIMWSIVTICFTVMKFNGIELTPVELTAFLGGPSLYTALKGKGR